MNSICSVGGDSSIADEVSDVLNSLSPSELNDIDSEDEEDTTKDYDSDEDLQVCYLIDSNHWLSQLFLKIKNKLNNPDSFGNDGII